MKKLSRIFLTGILTATILFSANLTYASVSSEGSFTNKIVQTTATTKISPLQMALGQSTKREATPIQEVKKVTLPKATSQTPVSSSSSGENLNAILAKYVAKYPALAGTTIEYGDARGNQAIAYYKSGRIIISPDHTASLDRIVRHECAHILDWRDNGVIDWGENVPAL